MAQPDPDGSHDGGSEDSLRTTPIYAHIADDGIAFCSYGVGHDELRSYGIEVERIETAFFNHEDADEVIDDLPPEGVREETHEGPAEVGTLTFSEAGIESIDISLDELVDPYPDEWTIPEGENGPQTASSSINLVFVLDGECLVNEIDMEGVATAEHIGAYSKSSLRESAHSYSPPSERIYKAATPRGDVLMRERDVVDIQRLSAPDSR